MSTTEPSPNAPVKLSPKELQHVVHEYILQTQLATLATVREDGAPVLRTMGSFAPEGSNVYFSTGRQAAKTRHIVKNSLVSFFFLHENQPRPTFRSVAIIGRAEALTGKPEREHAIALLSARNARFKARVENGEADQIGLYLIRTREIKYQNYANGVGPAAIQELIL